MRLAPNLTLLLLSSMSPLATAQAPQVTPALPDIGAHSNLQAQVLLQRAHFSPGEIDGEAGSNQHQAVSGYQLARGLTPNGELDEQTWQALLLDTAPILTRYTLTAEDVAGPFQALPKSRAARSKLNALGYVTVDEALGERFHASPKLLRALNPTEDLSKAGTTIQVPAIASTTPLVKPNRIVIDKSDSTLRLLDAAGTLYAQYPVSSGSRHDPLPLGTWKILGVSRDPTYHYNPKLFWDAKAGESTATLPPGPNNPVGRIWIGLSKPHYGIHGTPEPSRIGKTESHGCVRMTNWDVMQLADVVDTSVPVLMQE